MSKHKRSGFSKRQLIEKSSTTIVLSTALAAIILSFSVVMMNFMWSLSGHYNRVVSEKSKASKILEQNVDNIEQLQANFTIFEAGDVKSTTVLDALPSKYDFPALATTVESLVADTGLTMNSFGGSDIETQAIQSQTVPSPVELNFTLTVTGNYKNIQKLVDHLDRTIRPMKITRFELRGSDESMRATMSIITYYQPATNLEVETRTIE